MDGKPTSPIRAPRFSTRLPPRPSGCSKVLHRAPAMARWPRARSRSGELELQGARIGIVKQCTVAFGFHVQAAHKAGATTARKVAQTCGRGDEMGGGPDLHVRGPKGAGGLGPAHQLSAATRPAPLHLSKNTPNPRASDRCRRRREGARDDGQRGVRPRPAIRPPPGPSLRVAAPSSRRAAAPSSVWWPHRPTDQPARTGQAHMGAHAPHLPVAAPR